MNEAITVNAPPHKWQIDVELIFGPTAAATKLRSAAAAKSVTTSQRNFINEATHMNSAVDGDADCDAGCDAHAFCVVAGAHPLTSCKLQPPSPTLPYRHLAISLLESKTKSKSTLPVGVKLARASPFWPAFREDRIPVRPLAPATVLATVLAKLQLACIAVASTTSDCLFMADLHKSIK
ncbi:hypothetical protein ACLKA7_010279 [Drosophila subpalustris]